MQRKLNTLLLLFSVLFAFLDMHAQDDFSKDTEKFFKQLNKVLEKADPGKTKEFLPNYQAIFMTSYFSASRDEIIETFTKLQSKKYRPYPDYENFMLSQIVMAQNQTPAAEFSDWLKMVNNLVDGRYKKVDVQRFLDFSHNLYDKNYLYKPRSENVVWKADNGEFQMTLEKKGPVVKYEKLTLKCLSKDDHSIIHNTSGSYDVFEHQWFGKDGKVTWERASFDEEETYAILQEYSIDFRKSSFVADSAIFINKKYFSTPIMGKFEERIIADVKPQRVSYPRFDSYNSRFVIEDIIEGVDYDGGFSQHGIRFLGSGSPEDPARVIVYRDGKPMLTAYSTRFTIRMNDEEIEEDDESRKRRRDKEEKKSTQKNRIVSGNARIHLALDNDSITHPGLYFVLFTDDREVNLVRNDQGMAKSPFLNSFHDVEMRFELLQWRIDEPLMEFKAYPMSSNKVASFTSNAYFREATYNKLQGISSWHPLGYLNKCANDNGTTELTSSDVARCIGIPISQVEPMLLRYSYDGFVEFDVETKKVKILPKTKHFVHSKSQKTDYDVINVTSVADDRTDNRNASLSLLNYNLDIKGVDRITLSDSHSVEIYPTGREIVMKENRDFDFSGLINSGKVEFFGRNFSFGYENFKIDMPIVDSMQIWADSPKQDKYGNLMEARVRTLIKDLSGDLKIDQPDNKSGIKRLKKFPIFNSEQDSYAYYDAPNIQAGAYPKERFYFQLVPFQFDSLDNFKNENIQFSGTFVSANIFPDIEEKLVLREDYSLGFQHETPAGGYEAYGGAGTFDNTIDLSNRGLKGDGMLTYITSTTQSHDMTFFPDSMNTYTYQYDIEEQMAPVEYANASATEVYVHWMPYADYMDVETLKDKDPINMYAGVSSHKGSLRYSPQELIGAGANSFEGATLFSEKMEFKFFDLHADTSNFELNIDDLFDAIDFSCENVKADVNFKEREGNFVSNTGGSLTVFDIVQYQAWLDRFTWFMDSEEIEFSAEGEVVDTGVEDLRLEGAKFTSIHPDQDSLNWNAKAATYSLREKKILAKEVQFIDVADARVFPDRGFVTVHKNANMQPLKESKVIANRQLQYHTIYGSTVKIEGKWEYEGEGNYDYVDENGLIQTLEISEIGVDSTLQTYGRGEIVEDASFSLSPHFEYKGEFMIYAPRKPLTFDGYGKIKHDCKNVRLSWFSFNSEVDPDEILIEITDPAYNGGGEKIYNSMVIPRDSSYLYAAFLSKPESKEDVAMIPTGGLITYDKISREYQIANFEKLTERSLPGNYTSLNTKTCKIETEGVFTLADDISHFEVKPAGNFVYNTISNENEMNLILTTDFKMDKGIMEVLTKELQESEMLEAVDFDRNEYEVGLRDLVGQKIADDLLARKAAGKRVSVPDGLNKTLFFNQLTMKWDPTSQSFVSEGPIGIGNIGKEEVNRLVDGKIQFKNNRRSTDVVMYLELSPSKWYIFTFKGSTGLMKVYSTNKEFMDALFDVKPGDRKIKAEEGNRGYQYMNGSKNDRTRFLSQFE